MDEAQFIVIVTPRLRRRHRVEEEDESAARRFSILCRADAERTEERKRMPAIALVDIGRSLKSSLGA